jgi:hypothetical protein
MIHHKRAQAGRSRAASSARLDPIGFEAEVAAFFAAD